MAPCARGGTCRRKNPRNLQKKNSTAGVQTSAASLDTSDTPKAAAAKEKRAENAQEQLFEQARQLVRDGKLTPLKSILERNNNLATYQNPTHGTLLHQACRAWNAKLIRRATTESAMGYCRDVIALLLKEGADPEAENPEGETPLMILSKKNNDPKVQFNDLHNEVLGRLTKALEQCIARKPKAANESSFSTIKADGRVQHTILEKSKAEVAIKQATENLKHSGRKASIKSFTALDSTQYEQLISNLATLEKEFPWVRFNSVAPYDEGLSHTPIPCRAEATVKCSHELFKRLTKAHKVPAGLAIESHTSEEQVSLTIVNPIDPASKNASLTSLQRYLQTIETVRAEQKNQTEKDSLSFDALVSQLKKEGLAGNQKLSSSMKRETTKKPFGARPPSTRYSSKPNK